MAYEAADQGSKGLQTHLLESSTVWKPEMRQRRVDGGYQMPRPGIDRGGAMKIQQVG